MKNTAPMQSSFAMLFDPAVALAAAKRAAQWDLPRHICHPLDHYHGARVNSALAAYDAAVDLAPLSEDEMSDDPPAGAGVEISDADFDDTDDL
jgi:hypothetical protein